MGIEQLGLQLLLYDGGDCVLYAIVSKVCYVEKMLLVTVEKKRFEGSASHFGFMPLQKNYGGVVKGDCS